MCCVVPFTHRHQLKDMSFKLLVMDGQEEDPVYDKVEALGGKKLVACCGTNKILNLDMVKKLKCKLVFVSAVVLDRISTPAKVHVKDTMLGLVGGGTCTKFTNTEHF